MIARYYENRLDIVQIRRGLNQRRLDYLIRVGRYAEDRPNQQAPWIGRSHVAAGADHARGDDRLAFLELGS